MWRSGTLSQAIGRISSGGYLSVCAAKALSNRSAVTGTVSGGLWDAVETMQHRLEGVDHLASLAEGSP